MQNVSVKKLSILGLVLMAASAVTAAVIPSKSKEAKAFAAGSLTRNTGEASQSLSVTCSVSDDAIIASGDECNATATNAGSDTTGLLGDESASVTAGANTTVNG